MQKQERVQRLISSEDFRLKYIRRMGFDKIERMFEQGKGKSRHEGKKDGSNFAVITSVSSFKDSKQVFFNFAQFVAQTSNGDDLDGLESLIPYVDLYLQHCIDKGYSAYTLAKFRTQLAKVFGLSGRNFMKLPERRRSDIKRSRGKVEMDKHISPEKRAFYEKFGRATGLRRDEMVHIKGTALIKDNPQKGLYYLHITDHTKGGRPRFSPIMAKDEAELNEILDYFHKAGEGLVFHNVPKNYDQHSNRAYYAGRVYRHFERDLDTLSRKEKTCCRKDLKGLVLDKKAELKTSQALGHNRVGEFRKSYAWTLTENKLD